MTKLDADGHAIEAVAARPRSMQASAAEANVRRRIVGPPTIERRWRMGGQSDPSTDFEAARQVLRGARCSCEGIEVIKLLSLLLGDHDVVIDRSGFRVQRAWTRRKDSYFSRLAPTVVCALLGAVGGGPAAPDSRLMLNEKAVQSLTRGLCKGAFWLWLKDEEDAITIAIRACDAARHQPDVPEPLPLWRPSPQVWVDVAAARECPHCQRPSTSFRQLADSLVCRCCGRSFTPPSDL